MKKTFCVLSVPAVRLLKKVKDKVKKDVYVPAALAGFLSIVDLEKLLLRP